MKKKLTATNILNALLVIIYILDRYIIKIPAGYTGFEWIPARMPNWARYLFGYCGGRLTDKMALMGSIININGHAFYRYVTYMFMHVFLIHLMVNVWALFIIGKFVEKKLGPSLMLGIFLISGIIAGIASEPVYAAIKPDFLFEEIVVCGASGGILGLMGAGLIICLVSKDKFRTMKLSDKVLLGVYGVVFTYLANGEIVSYVMVSHNLGLIVGIVTMLLILAIKRPLAERLR